MIKKRGKLLFLLILVFTFNAWGKDGLVVYSGRHEKFVRPVMDEFSKKTGIKVYLLNSKSTALINRIKLEGKNTKVDAFISNDAGILQIGSDMGLFKPISKETLQGIDKNYRATDNTWVGLSARARVLVINSKYEKQLGFIKSVFDLADPRLLGKVAITDSANNSFIAGLSVYQALAGDKKTLAFLQGLKKNTIRKVYNKHSKIVEDVAKGKRWIGLVNHYYIYRHLDKHPKAPIKIILPDQGEEGMGVAWNISGFAIVKYTKKTKQVQQLLQYLLSKEGQEVFSKGNREYPVLKDAAVPKMIPKNYKVSKFPMSSLGKMRNKTLNLIEKVGLY